MPRPRLATILLLALAACGREDAPAVPDSPGAVPAVPVPDAPAPVASTGWEDHLGPALFVSSASGTAGGSGGAGAAGLEVVVPFITDSTFADSAAWSGATLDGAARVELFSRAGRLGAVRLPAGARVVMPALDDGCIGWPALRPADAPPAQWRVGFVEGRATAIPLDSIEALARGDSARLAADAAGLASQIPNDTATAFAGLPFAVRTAYRLRPGGDVEVLVAEVMRRIGQEADPREQHVFLAAERSGPTAPWRLAWHARSSGPEDAVETRELLAALRLGAGQVPTLVVAVTYNEGSSYTLVERTATGRWRERWSSAYTGC